MAGVVNPYTAVLADDHAVVRAGVRSLLAALPEVQVVAEAGDGAEALALAIRLTPDLLILDLSMPGLDGLQVIRHVGAQSPKTRCIVLSMHADEWHALEALRAGAGAYVLKQDAGEGLINAVRAVVGGRVYLSPPLSTRALETYAALARGDPRDRYDTLSPREREVFHLVGQGLGYKAVAARLEIGVRTVETHVETIRYKLGLRSREEIIRAAVEREMRSAATTG